MTKTVLNISPRRWGKATPKVECQGLAFMAVLRVLAVMESTSRPETKGYPKDPAVLRILHVVNLLRVVFLLSSCDLLWELPFSLSEKGPRRSTSGGGVVKTLRRVVIHYIFCYRRSIFSTAGKLRGSFDQA